MSGHSPIFQGLRRASSGAVRLAVMFAGALLLSFGPPGAAPARAAYGLAWGDAPKYPPDFSHFDYVNPDAPKGGSVNLDGFGSFDKINPFTLKGLAPAGVVMLMFETLAESSDDEPFSMYGLLARTWSSPRTACRSRSGWTPRRASPTARR